MCAGVCARVHVRACVCVYGLAKLEKSLCGRETVNRSASLEKCKWTKRLIRQAIIGVELILTQFEYPLLTGIKRNKNKKKEEERKEKRKQSTEQIIKT